MGPGAAGAGPVCLGRLRFRGAPGPGPPTAARGRPLLPPGPALARRGGPGPRGARGPPHRLAGFRRAGGGPLWLGHHRVGAGAGGGRRCRPAAGGPGGGGARPAGAGGRRSGWLAGVGQAVARFGWAITGWVLAREEPADADPLRWAREAVEHARLVQEAAAAIGRVQPGAQVRAAASAADLLWLEVFAREGGLGGLAGLVLEANRWPVPPEGLPVAIDEVRSLVREWGQDLELWVWRFGYPTHQ